MKISNFIRTHLAFILESLNYGSSCFKLSAPLSFIVKRKRWIVPPQKRYWQERYNRRVQKKRKGNRGK